MTIADALTNSATSGQTLFNYTLPLLQISRIHQFLRRDNFVNDIPITTIGQQEWDTLNNKSGFTGNNAVSTGLPNQCYYQRAIPKGILKVWPQPQTSLSIVWFWYEKKLGQLKNPTDVMDLDQFYYPALSYLLAYRLCDVFGVSTEMKMSIKATYEELMAQALSYDDEQSPVKITPNARV